MTPQFYSLLQDWLESGDEVQRSHAAYRLSLPDAIDYVPPAPVPYPPLLEQAKNAVQAAIGFAADGFRTVDQAEQDRRMAICRGCEHFDEPAERCRLCGCLAGWKARIESQSCPDGRW